MKTLDTVCIRCPVGCHLHVEMQNNEVVVSGNRCPRGAEYGKQEFTCPMRTLTTIYPLKAGGTLAVRTDIDADDKHELLLLTVNRLRVRTQIIHDLRIDGLLDF